ncbi:rod shape-determining protein MreC [Psittacicella hinzii]|uniref:rod shape-determining protein MreC n=1 Tax=Psittacicella hinzii TaxID=2028575 RepID=UPI001CA71E69|nr:rod shape-determining protein MreC [Psittacicella hinzii]
MHNAIFYKPKHFWRAITSFVIAVTLFCLSITKTIEPFKTSLDNLTNRIFIFNSGTKQFVNHISPNFRDVGSLNSANEQLQKQVVELQAQLNRFKAVLEENGQLKALLNISQAEIARFDAVNVINTEQGVKSNIIFIDKGTNDGIFYGQNIVDAYGLIGQIISVSDNQSRVLMITDINSYVPVYNSSNQEAYLLKGTNSSELLVEHIRPKSTLKVGDILYTSGLAKRFIKNYQVAKVSRVITDNNNNVIRAYAEPLAHLSSLRYMVALWPYCEVNPAKSALNLVYNREFMYNSLNARNYSNKRKTNFLNYTYKGINPENLSIGKYLERLNDLKTMELLSYKEDTDLGRQHCYTINQTRVPVNTEERGSE